MTGLSIIGSLIGDRWRVTSLLGRGGFGETVQDDADHVFWNLDDLGRPEVTCEIVAVEFE